MKHETEYDVPDASWEPDLRPGIEAQVVNVADEIAYNAHDLDDGLRSGHLDVKEVARVPLIARLMDRLAIDPNAFETRDRYVLVRELLGMAIDAVIEHSEERIRAAAVASIDDVRAQPLVLVGPDDALAGQLAELKRFLYEHFYFHHRLIRMTRKADHILERIYGAYCETPSMLAPDVRRQAEALGLERAVVDYLAGMTDRFAIKEYRRLFDPTTLT